MTDIDRCTMMSEIHQKDSVHIPEDSCDCLCWVCYLEFFWQGDWDASVSLILFYYWDCSGKSTSHLWWWLCQESPHPLPHITEEVWVMLLCMPSCDHPSII
jgi:hypothetical protein